MLDRRPVPADFEEEAWPVIQSQIVQCLRDVRSQLAFVVQTQGSAILGRAATNCYLTLIEDLEDHYVEFSVAMGEPERLEVV